MTQPNISINERKQLIRITLNTIHFFAYGNSNRLRNTFKIKDLRRMEERLQSVSDQRLTKILRMLIQKNVVIPIISDHTRRTCRYRIDFNEDELNIVLHKCVR